MAYSVSSRWEKFIRRGFHPITKVDVTFPGEGVVFSNLPVSNGSVSMTRGSAVRASGSIEVPSPDLFPALNDDSPIAPYGAELIIKTGIAYPEAVNYTSLSIDKLEALGYIEMVPMGVFVIGDANGSEAKGNVTSLTFYDRAKLLEDADAVIPKDYGGTSAKTTITNIITDATPWVTDNVSWNVIIDPSVPDITLPAGTTFDTGRWSFIEKVAEALGAEVYFGRDGNVYVVPIPGVAQSTTTLDADWLVDVGEDGVLIDVNRKISRTGVFNGVVVTGSADGDNPQPFAFVTDDNPASRTYYGGPFGKLVKKIDNSNLTTNAQCQEAAKAELKNSTGLQRSISFETYGNPAMDPGDIILLRTQDNPDEIHMLDSYSYDFESASLSAETRSIQFVT